MPTLEQKVSELREKSNKSLMSLAKDIDANYETLKSQLRSGNLNATWLLKISYILNFSIDDLKDEVLNEWKDDFDYISENPFLKDKKPNMKPEAFSKILGVYRNHGEKYANDLCKVEDGIIDIYYEIEQGEEEFSYPIGGLGSHGSSGYYLVLADQYLKDIPDTIEEKEYFKNEYDQAYKLLYKKYGEVVNNAIVINRNLYLRSAIYFKIEGKFWEALLSVAKEGKYHNDGELLKDIIVKLLYIEQEVSKQPIDENNIVNVINDYAKIIEFLNTFEVKKGAIMKAFDLINEDFKRIQNDYSDYFKDKIISL
jgi:hypothetical protein